MIKHVVMYKLKDAAAANALAAKFESMRGKISVLKGLTAGVDILQTNRSYDVCLICDFDDRQGLEEYAVHPVHLPVKEYVKAVVAQSHAVDFEY